MDNTHKMDDNKVPASDRIAARIAGGIVRSQLYIAGKLQKAEGKCSTLQKKVLLLLFCNLFGGYLLFLAADALFREEPSGGESIIPVQKQAPAVVLPLSYKSVRGNSDTGRDSTPAPNTKNK